MNVVLLSGDLTVLPRVEAAAARLGAMVRPVSGWQQAIDACREEPGAALVIDLATPQIDVGILVHALHQRDGSSTRIIAFGPHVHEERLNEARQAGCDEVISRGQFFAKLDRILSRSVTNE
jgi:CheY-like chemotaxis protein